MRATQGGIRGGDAPARAFSLIELLVVIALVTILAAMLLPGLSRSKFVSLRTQCLNNQHEIGLGFSMYADDSRGYFPVCAGWACVGGKFWTNALTTGHATQYGGQVPESQRPLNKYVPNLNTFHCPSDLGDAWNPSAKSCWLAWGNSYLTEWMEDAFRVQHVTASSREKPGTPKATPISTATIARNNPVTKIIQGDFPWHGNRSSTNPKDLWHTTAGVRADNMLFADNHATFYQFPDEISGWVDVPPEPKFTWW